MLQKKVVNSAHVILVTVCKFEMYKKFIETGTRKGGKSLGKYNWVLRRFLQFKLSIDEKCTLLIVYC